MERDVPDVVIGSAVLSMRGVGLTRHVDEADVPKRREHRGTRPDDDVVAAVTHGEPVSVAPPLVAAEIQADPVAEGRSERCGRRGDGCRLGDHHDRAPPAGETRTDGVNGGGLLVFRRRSQDERPRPRGSLGAARPHPDSPRAWPVPAAPAAVTLRRFPSARGRSLRSRPWAVTAPRAPSRAARRIAHSSTSRVGASPRRRTGPARHAASPGASGRGARRRGRRSRPASACRGIGHVRTSRRPLRARPGACT
jgi:hypothetical protein